MRHGFCPFYECHSCVAREEKKEVSSTNDCIQNKKRSKWVRITTRFRRDLLSQCFLVDFLKKKIEKKVGMDLDGDGRIGGSGHGSGGPMGQVEKALNVDLNHDGRIGGGAAAGHKPTSGSGGKSIQQPFF